MIWEEYVAAAIGGALLAGPLCVIIYILFGVEGNTWAANSLNFSMYAASAINFFGFWYLLVLNPTCLGFSLNAGFSLLLVLSFLLAAFGCFPGTGNRIGNCGSDVFVFVGVANFFILAVVNLPASLTLIPIIPIVFLATLFSAYYYLSYPLWRELEKIDFKEECVFYKPSVYDRMDAAIRLSSPRELSLGLFIGEHSPRIHVLKEHSGVSWLYSKRKFSYSYEWPEIPAVCNNGATQNDKPDQIHP